MLYLNQLLDNFGPNFVSILQINTTERGENVTYFPLKTEQLFLVEITSRGSFF